MPSACVVGALTLASFGRLDWGIIGLYLAVVVAIGAWASRGQHDDRTYFLGGRRMPVWAVALSVLATTLSAVTFLGAPQEAFAGDLSYLVLTLGQFIAAIIVAVLFVPAMFRAGTMTIYGYVGQRFDPTARIAVGATFLLGRLLASGARLFVAAIAVSLLLFSSAEQSTGQLVTAIVLLGAIGTLYTAWGGIRAVIWTDVLQIIVVVGVAVLSIWLLLDAIPLTVSQIVERLQEPVTIPATETSPEQQIHKLTVVDSGFDLAKPYTLWTGLFAVVFLNMGWYGTDQDLAQRILTCRSAWRGGLSVIGGQIVGVAVTLLFMIVGLLLFVFNDPQVMGPTHQASFASDERVYPQFLVEHLPTGLSGLAMAGLFAAAMSSLDSAINAMAGSFIADVWRPIRRRLGHRPEEIEPGTGVARRAVVAMGVALTGFAVLAALIYDPRRDTLLGFSLAVMTFAYAGMLGVFLTGLLTRRGNTASVLAALAAGALTYVVLQIGLLDKAFGIKLAWPWWMVVGTGASFLACAAGRPADQNKV